MLLAISGMTALAAPPAELRDAVVVVQQGAATCAGVVLDDGAVATAYHCVAGGFGAHLELRDGQRTRARVRARDPRHDLALLEPVEPLGPGVAGAPAPAVGSPVRVIGHPWAASAPTGFLQGTLRWSTARGRVSNVGERSLQLDATIAPGNSGGPVFDEEGRVVGIVSRRIGDGIGFAGRAEALQALRDEPRRPPLGGSLTIAPVAWWSARRPVIGIDLDVTWRERIVLGVRGGLPVAPWTGAILEQQVEATPTLARAGLRLPLRAGDTALALDGFVAVGLTRTWTSPDGGPPRVTGRVDGFVGGAFGSGGLTVEAARRVGPDAATGWLLGLRLGLGALRRVW